MELIIWKWEVGMLIIIMVAMVVETICFRCSICRVIQRLHLVMREISFIREKDLF